jgi:hypothetical protein
VAFSGPGHKGVLKSGAPFKVIAVNIYMRIITILIWNKDEIEVSAEWLDDNAETYED